MLNWILLKKGKHVSTLYIYFNYIPKGDYIMLKHTNSISGLAIPFRDHSVYVPANERWCHTVTLSLIGWGDTQNDPWPCSTRSQVISSHGTDLVFRSILCPTLQGLTILNGNSPILWVTHMFIKGKHYKQNIQWSYENKHNGSFTKAINNNKGWNGRILTCSLECQTRTIKSLI